MVEMIPFPGDKARLAKTICSFALQSSGDTYCEPFAGRDLSVIEQQTYLTQAQTTEVLAKAAWVKRPLS
jgi:hypothetical protein